MVAPGFEIPVMSLLRVGTEEDDLPPRCRLSCSDTRPRTVRELSSAAAQFHSPIGDVCFCFLINGEGYVFLSFFIFLYSQVLELLAVQLERRTQR